MPYLSIRDVLDKEKKHYRLIQLPLAFVTSMGSLCLIAFASMSAYSFLDKPIPTGPVNELIGYASGALFVAALILSGTLSVLMSIKYLLRVRAELRAKVISVAIINRISAKANEEKTVGRASSSLIKVRS